MAAPSPYWKRKTRPCPFYSQGRCLFADSCNFVHSVKVNPSALTATAGVPFEESECAEAAAGTASRHAPDARSGEVAVDGQALEGGGDSDVMASPAGTASLTRSSSSSVRRRSVMSPPRSPRLSGLLSVLEPLIGPDVEEFEDVEKEDLESDQERIMDEPVASSQASPPSSNICAWRLDKDNTGDKEQDPDSPRDDEHNAISFEASITAPKPFVPRGKVPAPIITHSSRPQSVFYNPISGNTLELRSLRPQSTLDLLASPFLSPVLRIPSPTLVRPKPESERRPYSDDDLESFDSYEIAVKRSDSRNSSFGSPIDEDSSAASECPKQSFESITNTDPSSVHLQRSSLTSGSPQETERPLSDSFRTPLVYACHDDANVTELDGLPALPPSLLMFEDEDAATAGPSQIRILSEDRPPTSPIANSSSGLSSPKSWTNSRSYLSPITTHHASSSSLNSPSVHSLGPSPVSTDMNSSYTSDTLIEPDIEEDWVETKSVDTKVLLRLSPTKMLRDSFMPETYEKTVRAAPSALRDDSLPSESSESAISSAASWENVSNRPGQTSKVSFGFRQPSLGRSRSSRLSREVRLRTTASTSSLSPPSVYSLPPSESHSNRARSASPALFNINRDHSLRANSDPPYASPSARILPRSASQSEFVSNQMRSDSPLSITGPSSPAHRPHWMRPLRLSQLIHSPIYPNQYSSQSASSVQKRYSTSSSAFASHNRKMSQGTSVNNSLPYSARSSLISAYLNESAIVPHDTPRSFSPSSTLSPAHRQRGSDYITRSRNTTSLDLLSPLSGSMRGFDFNELSRWRWPNSNGADQGFKEAFIPAHPGSGLTTTPNGTSPDAPQAPHKQNSPATVVVPSHAIATPRPTLLFAIASDDPKEVERVLSEGEARPDDDVGPQTALEFALTNDALQHKTEIVKLLLAYGANPNVLPQHLRNANVQHAQDDVDEHEVEEHEDVLSDLPSEGSFSSQRKKRESMLNPAMKYYLNRAAGSLSSAALRRTDFRSLGRMRFDFVGQDRALEHLYWVLSMHSQQPIGTPLVVLCCGPSGHGKSLLARKFGSLLDVPTHTVNMTILKTSHDLWQCPSMSPYDQPSDRTLAEFLADNEGKRCVVVLDEIDKNEDERTLWSLLAPWELGRCSIDAGRRHIDVRNVIWLGTSNIGQDLIFEHYDARADASSVISKTEYRELMNVLRPRVTERLGTSLMSRVTAVLPFVPFTDEEKLAIASEAILALGDESASVLGPDEFEKLAGQCVAEYVHSEGARSLYRSASTHLMELF